VYGEVADALHHARAGGLQPLAAAWEFQRSLLAHLETVWRSPDDGIWEVRGERRHFTHSKVMAWVAFDRAIKSVEMFRLNGPVERWSRIRAEIHEEVCRRAFNAKLGAFGRQRASDSTGRLFATRRCAHTRDGRSDRTKAAARRACSSLRHCR
jgi:GH15 family glucan-1,4-alpha-glucosidase